MTKLKGCEWACMAVRTSSNLKLAKIMSPPLRMTSPRLGICQDDTLF